MPESFHAAALDQPPLILGQRLRPLAIGHYSLLSAIASPFIEGGQANLGDCLIAFAICYRTFEEAREWVWTLQTGKPDISLTALGGKAGMPDLSTLITLMDRHVRSGLRNYPRIAQVEHSRRIRLPLDCYLVSMLMRYCHMTESAAWNTPLALAGWYVIGAKGEDDMIWTDQDRDMESVWDQINAARQAARSGAN